MTANIKELPRAASLDYTPDEILASVASEDLKSILIVGVLDDGSLYVTCSHSKVADTLLLLKQGQLFMDRQIEGLAR